ncbi:MAG: hypothetical protein Q8L87_11835 [Anaerolineales bacterium]|nr:hypothetical protein [Anaerolineales bacterium]
MVLNHPLKLFLILTLTALACGYPTASSSPIPVPVEPTVPTPTGLTLEQINAAQYPALVREDGFVVQLADVKLLVK